MFLVVRIPVNVNAGNMQVMRTFIQNRVSLNIYKFMITKFLKLLVSLLFFHVLCFSEEVSHIRDYSFLYPERNDPSWNIINLVPYDVSEYRMRLDWNSEATVNSYEIDWSDATFEVSLVEMWGWEDSNWEEGYPQQLWELDWNLDWNGYSWNEFPTKTEWQTLPERFFIGDSFSNLGQLPSGDWTDGYWAPETESRWYDYVEDRWRLESDGLAEAYAEGRFEEVYEWIDEDGNVHTWVESVMPDFRDFPILDENGEVKPVFQQTGYAYPTYNDEDRGYHGVRNLYTGYLRRDNVPEGEERSGYWLSLLNEERVDINEWPHFGNWIWTADDATMPDTLFSMAINWVIPDDVKIETPWWYGWSDDLLIDIYGLDWWEKTAKDFVERVKIYSNMLSQIATEIEIQIIVGEKVSKNPNPYFEWVPDDVVSYYTDTPIIVDGDINEWTTPYFVPEFMSRHSFMVNFEPWEFQLGYPSYDPWPFASWHTGIPINSKDLWPSYLNSGPDDQQIWLNFNNDENWLYIAAFVVDEFHDNINNSSWNGDSIQVVITNPDKTEKLLFVSAALGRDGVISDMHVGNYYYEVSISRVDYWPATIYEMKIPIVNKQFGIGVVINDGDSGQFGQRGWGGIAPHSVVLGGYPSKAATLVLANRSTVADVLNSESYQIGVTVPYGFSMIANPLNNGNNIISDLMPAVPENVMLYKLVDGSYNINIFEFGEWSDPSMTLSPGEGAFIFNPDYEFEVVFVGEINKESQRLIPQGISIISLPMNSDIESGLPVSDGDIIYQFDNATGKYIVSVFEYEEWNNVPNIKIGESFFINKM